jgi:hypothetical protein
VLFAKGITDDSHFIERALSNLREFMEADGQAFVYQRFIVPATGSVLHPRLLLEGCHFSHVEAWLDPH